MQPCRAWLGSRLLTQGDIGGHSQLPWCPVRAAAWAHWNSSGSYHSQPGDVAVAEECECVKEAHTGRPSSMRIYHQIGIV